MSGYSYRDLCRIAQAEGVRINLHFEANYPFLAAPERREVFIYSRLDERRRAQLLHKALCTFGLQSKLAPLACQRGAELVDTIAEGEETLREGELTVKALMRPTPDAELPALGPKHNGPQSPSRVTRGTKPSPIRDAGQPHPKPGVRLSAVVASHRCELCGGKSYAVVQGLSLCRHHLHLTVAGELEVGEVRAIRRRHGSHPEVSFERYDGKGRPRVVH